MNQELLDLLYRDTEEEIMLKSGVDVDVERYYTSFRENTVDASKMMRTGALMDVKRIVRYVPFPKHRHNFIEITYMCSGTTTHIINDTHTIVLEPGNLLLLNQNTYHEVLTAGENDIGINFMILPELFEKSTEMLGPDSALLEFISNALFQKNAAGHFIYLNAADVLPIQNLVENMIWITMIHPQSANTKNKYSMALLLAHLVEFSDVLYDSRIHEKRYDDLLIMSILKYINERYQNASLKELSERLNQPSYRLCKLIKQATGQTFKKLLQQKRMSVAKTMLLYGDEPIDVILRSVGYDNSSYFYRIFTESVGCSPGEFRNQKGAVTKEMQNYFIEA